MDDIARVERLARARGTPIVVRLVKGAYWDEETVLARQESRQSPVFLAKAATDASFERCTERLLAAWPHLRPAFGTHNPRSIVQAMVRAETAGVPNDLVEFQMLYGMAEGLRKAVHAAGYRTRVYVPVGAIIPGMAYLVRRLLENTSNQSWFMHRHEEGDPADLLAIPSRRRTAARRYARLPERTPGRVLSPGGARSHAPRSRGRPRPLCRADAAAHRRRRAPTPTTGTRSTAPPNRPS